MLYLKKKIVYLVANNLSQYSLEFPLHLPPNKLYRTCYKMFHSHQLQQLRSPVIYDHQSVVATFRIQQLRIP